MKKIIKRISKSSLSVVLCIMMVMSTMLVGTITTANAADSVTVYYQNTNSWDIPTAYSWGGSSGAPAAWPGQTMSDVGNGVYSVSIPSDNTSIIFSNNGVSQTADLSLPSGWATTPKIYNNGAWSDYYTPVTTAPYIAGTNLPGDNWNQFEMTLSEDGKYYYFNSDVGITSDKYPLFRITKGDTDYTLPTNASYDETLTTANGITFGYYGSQNKGDNSATITNTASFNQIQFRVEVATSKIYAVAMQGGYAVSWKNPDNGSITVNGKTSPVTIAENETYTVNLTPDTGYEIDTFTVDGVSKIDDITNNQYVGTMGSSAVTVNATFKAINYTITPNTDSNGTIAIDGTPNIGQQITVTAKPSENYKVTDDTVTVEAESDVTVNVSRNGNVFTFTMPASNVTVNATFASAVHTAYADAATNGIITIQNGSETVPNLDVHEDTDVVFSITPDTGYQIDSVVTFENLDSSTDVTNLVEDCQLTIRMGEKDFHVQATFKVIEPSVALSAEKGNVYFGESVELTPVVTPDGLSYNSEYTVTKDGSAVDASTVMTGNNFAATAAGKYVVTYTATATVGGNPHSASVTITVTESPEQAAYNALVAGFADGTTYPDPATLTGKTTASLATYTTAYNAAQAVVVDGYPVYNGTANATAKAALDAAKSGLKDKAKLSTPTLTQTNYVAIVGSPANIVVANTGTYDTSTTKFVLYDCDGAEISRNTTGKFTLDFALAKAGEYTVVAETSNTETYQNSDPATFTLTKTTVHSVTLAAVDNAVVTASYTDPYGTTKSITEGNTATDVPNNNTVTVNVVSVDTGYEFASVSDGTTTKESAPYSFAITSDVTLTSTVTESQYVYFYAAIQDNWGQSYAQVYDGTTKVQLNPVSTVSNSSLYNGSSKISTYNSNTFKIAVFKIKKGDSIYVGNTETKDYAQYVASPQEGACYYYGATGDGSGNFCGTISPAKFTSLSFVNSSISSDIQLNDTVSINTSVSAHNTNSAGQTTLTKTYKVTKPDGTVVVLDKNTFTADQMGKYTITAQLADSVYCSDVSKNVAVTRDSIVGEFIVSTPLADSVTLATNKDQTTVGKSITLTASLVNPVAPQDGSEIFYTYEFFNGSTSVGKVPNTALTTAKLNLTMTTAGTNSYTVVVSTNNGMVVDSQQVPYKSVTSNPVGVTVSEPTYYMSSDITESTDAPTWTNIGSSGSKTVNATVAAGGTYTFALSDEGAYSEEFSTEFNVDNDLSNYCTITTGSTEDGIKTYIVKANAGCVNPTITVDIANKKIYAVATYTPSTSKTEDSSKTVTYYFAEHASETGDSLSGDGVRIKYYNNSTGNTGYTDVTTKATLSNGTSNNIYVATGDLYQGSVTSAWNGSLQNFKIYKVELPIWATSFAFVSSGSNVINTYSTTTAATNYASLGLNPNRVYLIYHYGTPTALYYAKGVVLDESLWDSSRSLTNQVSTKSFNANAINYATGYTTSGTKGIETTGFNNDDLSPLYSSSYTHPLYFGYFDSGSTGGGLTNFKIWDNLAMRNNNDEKYYYASVQGLVGNKLSNNTNANGYNTLLGYDNQTEMPLFDYNTLSSKSNVASSVSQGLSFPFYQSSYNGVTTYSYDSYTDKNRVISGGDFTVSSDYAESTINTGSAGVGYFPYGNNTYGFSTEFDIDFYMTDTGKLKDSDGNLQDIAFNFSGDDDVWVYIDGVLALDLGGDHKSSAGSINFSDMKVYYKSAAKDTNSISSISDSFATNSSYIKAVDLSTLLAANGVSFSNKDSSTKHTLQMFYMERGCFDSNCSISFNLPQNSGLRVDNDVNVDKVNNAFKDESYSVANNDYFSYQIYSKLASDSEYNAVKNTFSSAPAKATTYSSDYYDLANPVFPIITEESIIRRVVNGKEYVLAIPNTSGSQSNDYTTGKDGSTYIPLDGANYSLSDVHAEAAQGGSNEVSGRVDSTGKFNILYDETAQFESKIKSNSLIQLVQNDTLGSVVEADGAAITAGDTNTRKVSDYYTTAYTVTDDKSGATIGKRDDAVNTGSIYADDSSSLDNAFYFANYADATSNSVAMTASYTNYVAVGNIVIDKSLAEGSNAGNEQFFFDVEFSNVFGGDSATAAYPQLTYTVYNSNGNDATTRTYGSSGVILQAGQYAVISGVPVGTKYTVTERARAGFGLDSVTATITKDNGTAVDGNYVYGSLTDTYGEVPVVSATAVTDYDNASTATFKFVNKQHALQVNFNYYDRKVESGKVAHIDENPSAYTYSFSSFPSGTTTTDDNGEINYINIAQLISNASSTFELGNVIDKYSCWTSQADAVSGMQTMANLHNADQSTYSADQSVYHTDCYGNPQTSGEKWVTYYDSKGREITPEQLAADSSLYNSIASVNVWYYNTLNEYTLTMHTASDATDLTQVTDGDVTRYVAQGGTASTFTAYYNLRLGTSNDDEYIDGEGAYLKNYGITSGYIGTYPNTASDIEDGDNSLKFLYWAYDTEGKYIASTNRMYGYRITADVTLYPVYGDPSTMVNPGLTVGENAKDVYFDNNGISKTRLNTIMNTYNCPDSDANIKQVSVVYVMMKGIDVDKLTDEQLAKIKTDIQAILNGKTAGKVSGSVTVTVSAKASGFVYDVKPQGETSGTYEVYLTNKNRVQFSTTFTTSTLKSYERMFAFAAMNYYSQDTDSSSWIVSDNYIDYDFR